MSAVNQTAKALKSGSRDSVTGCSRELGSTPANDIKAFSSPSLPLGHNHSACQNPCEFTLYSKLHVPAAQCDTIRS